VQDVGSLAPYVLAPGALRALRRQMECAKRARRDAS
jgi:hypothetical protein